jgi:hypothetical protein
MYMARKALVARKYGKGTQIVWTSMEDNDLNSCELSLGE